MGFIDSYKHLEKLCGDMLQTQHGVSAYIAEMESTPNGSYWVQGWVEDLKCLKHYRWVRNQIVHDPNSSEENINAGTSNTLSPKMYYINKYYWDIALLSLVYSTAEDDKQFLKETIGRDTVDHIFLNRRLFLLG